MKQSSNRGQVRSGQVRSRRQDSNRCAGPSGAASAVYRSIKRDYALNRSTAGVAAGVWGGTVEQLEARRLLSGDGSFDPAGTPFVLVHGLFGSGPRDVLADEWYTNRSAHPDDLVLDPLAGLYDDIQRTMLNAGYDSGPLPDGSDPAKGDTWQPDADRTYYSALYDWRNAPTVLDNQMDGRVTNVHVGGGVQFLGQAGQEDDRSQYSFDIIDDKFEAGIDYLGFSLKRAAEDRYLRYLESGSGDPFVKEFTVDMAVHSTGGLVSRAYLQSDAYRGDFTATINGVQVDLQLPGVNDYFQIAVPNRGSVNAWIGLDANYGHVNDPSYRAVLSKILYRSMLLNGQGYVITSDVPGDDIAAGAFPSDFAEKINTVGHRSGDPERLPDGSRNYHYIVEEISRQYAPTMQSLLSTFAFIDKNLDDATDTPGSVVPDDQLIAPQDIGNSLVDNADNPWLLDLNDGLDKLYVLPGETRPHGVNATASDIGGQLGWDDPAAGRVRRPNAFLDSVQGDTYVYFSRAWRTFMTSIRRTEVNTEFGPLALPPIVSLNEFYGHFPTQGELYYENKLEESPYRGGGAAGLGREHVLRVDGDGNLLDPTNDGRVPDVAGGAVAIDSYDDLIAGDGTVPTVSAIGQFVDEPTRRANSHVGHDGNATRDLYLFEATKVNADDVGSPAGVTFDATPMFNSGGTVLGHTGLTGSFEVQLDILRRLGVPNLDLPGVAEEIVSTDIARNGIELALRVINSGALDPAFAALKENTPAQSIAGGLQVGLSIGQQWLRNERAENPDAFFNREIPILGRSLYDMLQPGEIIDSVLIQPAIDYLADQGGAGVEKIGDWMAGLAEGFNKAAGLVNLGEDPALSFGPGGAVKLVLDTSRTGFHILGDGGLGLLLPVVNAANDISGLDSFDADELLGLGLHDGVGLTLAGRAELDTDLSLRLGINELADLGIAVAADTTVRLKAFADIEFTVGYRLNSGTSNAPLASDEKFYIRPVIKYGAAIDGQDVDLDLVVGLLKAKTRDDVTSRVTFAAEGRWSPAPYADGSERTVLNQREMADALDESTVTAPLMRSDGTGRMDTLIAAIFDVDGYDALPLTIIATTAGEGTGNTEGDLFDGEYKVRINGQTPQEFFIDSAYDALRQYVPGDVLAIAAQLRTAIATVLQQIGDQTIPFTDTTLDELVDEAGLASVFGTALPNGETVNSLDAYAERLGTGEADTRVARSAPRTTRGVARGSVSGFRVEDGPDGKQVVFDFEHDLAGSQLEANLAAGDIELSFGGLDLAGVESNAKVTITADLKLRLQIGVSLARQAAELVAGNALTAEAAGGLLLTGATLGVRLDNEVEETDEQAAADPQNVTPRFHALSVAAGRYGDAAGLVAAVNAAIAATPALAGRVEAGLSDATAEPTLTLRAVGETEIIEVRADLGDAAVRELGFISGQQAIVEPGKGVFIAPVTENGQRLPTIGGDLSVALSSGGAANFGEAYVGPLKVALTNPTTSNSLGNTGKGSGPRLSSTRGTGRYFGAAAPKDDGATLSARSGDANAIVVRFGLNVANPNDPAGRTNLNDLRHALRDDVADGSWLTVADDTGAGTLTFGLTSELEGVTDAADPADQPVVVIRYGQDKLASNNLVAPPPVPDLFPDADDLQIEFGGDFQNLLPFQDLSIASVIEAIGALAGWLLKQESVQDTLAAAIPGFDANIAKAVGIAQDILDAVEQATAGETPEVLGVLTDKLNEAFRELLELPADATPFGMVVRLVDGSPMLQLDVEFAKEMRQIDSGFALALDALWADNPNLEGLDNINGEVDGDYFLSVGGRANLTVGLDLSDPLAGPLLFEGEPGETTGVFLGFGGGATGFNASFGAGALDLIAVTNGKATIPAPATVADLGTQTPGGEQTGQLYFAFDPADGSSYLPITGLDGDDFTFDLDGTLDVDLPVVVAELDQLSGSINVDASDIGDLSTFSVNADVPDFADGLDAFDILNDLSFLLDAVDFGLAGLETLLNVQLFGTEVPIIGDELKSVADLVANIREQVRTEIADRLGPDATTTGLIEEALEAAFGGLGLIDTGTGDSPNITHTILTNAAGTKNIGVVYDIDLEKDIELTQASFDLGLDTIGLSLDELKFALNAMFKWHFGFGATTTDGFFFALHETNGSDLSLELSADVKSPAAGQGFGGSLLFLDVLATGTGEDNDTFASLTGGVEVDLVGTQRQFTFESPDGGTSTMPLEILKPADIGRSTLGSALLTFDAAANFNVEASFAGGDYMPSLTFDVAMGWLGGQVDLLGNAPSSAGGLSLALNNVEANMGGFVSKFLKPMIDKVEDALDPLKPVIDFLTQRIPVMSDLAGRPVTILDLAALYSDLPIDPRFIYAVKDLLDLAERIPDGEGDLIFPIGNLNLTGQGVDITKPGSLDKLDPSALLGGNASSLLDGLNNLHAGDARTGFINDLMATKADGAGGGGDGGGGGGITGGGFKIPLLDDPTRIVNVILGRNVSLIDWTPPELKFGYEFETRQPIFTIGPATVWLQLYGGLNVSANFSVGFSTRGFRAFADAVDDGFDLADLGDLFYKGLYISDRADAGLGQERPEVVVAGGIGLDLQLSAGPAFVGGGGDLAARVEFDLRDGEGVDDDGLVHLDEFVSFFQVDPLCIFESISGTVDIGARFQVGIDLLFDTITLWEYRTPRFTLVDFEVDIDCDPLSQEPSSVETVDIGRGPGQHIESYIGKDVARRHRFEASFGGVESGNVGVEVSLQGVEDSLSGSQSSKVNTAISIVDEEGNPVLERNTLAALGDSFKATLEAGRTYFLVVENNTGEAAEWIIGIDRTEAGIGGRTFYVNDNRSDNVFGFTPPEDASGLDRYTTRAGNDATARPDDPTRPFRTIGAVVENYDLDPGDVILLDASNGQGYEEALLNFGPEDDGFRLFTADPDEVIRTAGLRFDGASNITLSDLNFRDVSGGTSAAVEFASGASNNVLSNLSFNFVFDDDPTEGGTAVSGGYRRGVVFGVDATANTVVGLGIGGDGQGAAAVVDAQVGANNVARDLFTGGFRYGIGSKGTLPAPDPQRPDAKPVAVPVTFENAEFRGTSGSGSAAVLMTDTRGLTVKNTLFTGYNDGLVLNNVDAPSFSDVNLTLTGSTGSRAASFTDVTAGTVEDLRVYRATEGLTLTRGGNNVLREITLNGTTGANLFGLGGDVRGHVLKLVDSIGNRIENIIGGVRNSADRGLILDGAENNDLSDLTLRVEGAGAGVELIGARNNRLLDTDLVGSRTGVLGDAATIGFELRNALVETTGDGVVLPGGGAHRVEDAVIFRRPNQSGTSVGLVTGGDLSVVRNLEIDGHGLGMRLEGGGYVADVEVGQAAVVGEGVQILGAGELQRVRITATGRGALLTGDTVVNETVITAGGTGVETQGNALVTQSTIDAFDVGVTVDDLGTFENVSITSANAAGVVVGGDGVFTDNTITALLEGIIVNGGSATVTRGSVTAGATGVDAVGAATVTDATVTSTAGDGVRVGGTGNVAGSTVVASRTGVSVVGDADVRSNDITADDGVVTVGDAIIDDNDVTAANDGIDTGIAATIRNNRVTAGATGIRTDGAATVTDNTVVANTFGIDVGPGGATVADNTVTRDAAATEESDGTGVRLNPGVGGDVLRNEISLWGVGLDTGTLTAVVLANTIRDNVLGATGNGQIGSADPLDTPQRNQIHDNVTGVRLDPTHTAAVVRYNDVYDNDLGIERLNHEADLLRNDVFGNDLGMRIVGDLGFDSWAEEPNVVRENVDGIELVGPGADPDGTQTLKFTVLQRNTGRAIIITNDDVELLNNKLQDNAEGVRLQGVGDVLVRNNTIVGPGDSISVADATGPVTVRNNIAVTETGAALDVDAQSVWHLDSDHNLLTHGGLGLAVRHLKDFPDLYDWQVESGFDLRSLGYTVVDPTRDTPRFVDLAAGDMRLLPGQPAVDAGDPLTVGGVGNEPGDGGGRINLGAYGGDPQAAPTSGPWVRLASPDFYEDRPAAEGRFVSWESHGVTGDVRLELLDDAGAKLADVAQVAAAQGSFLWTPQDQGVAGSDDAGYRLRITSVDTAATYTTREQFAIVGPGSDFYVNDAATAGDTSTTAPGDNRNTGLAPDEPKASVRPVLLGYQLGAGDTVNVDAGDYTVVDNLFLTNELGVGDDEGFTLRGAGSGVTRLDRANPFATAKLFDLDDADNVTIEGITGVGGVETIHVGERSDGLTLRDVAVEAAAGVGLLSAGSGLTADGLSVTGTGGTGVVSSGTDVALGGVSVTDAGGDGVSVTGRNTTITDAEVRGSAGAGVRAVFTTTGDARTGALTGSTVAGNAGGGVIVETRSGDDAFLLGGLPGTGLGNVIADNGRRGVDARHSVAVVGNAVTQSVPTPDATADSGSIGITAIEPGRADLDVLHNVVTGFDVGILAGTFNSNTDIDLAYNRVEPAAGGTGLRFGGAIDAVGNEVRGGAVGLRTGGPRYDGVQVGSFTTGDVLNNLLVGQTATGARLDRFYRSGEGFRNNTVVPAAGGAGVSVGDDGEDVRLTNNIIRVDGGTAVGVSNDSRDGFASNHNLLHVTGGGATGTWQGVTHATLAAWRAATSRDGDSLASDPAFVGNGDYHPRSVAGSFHGGSLAPVLDAATGLPVAAAGTLTPDADTSPAVDRADPATPIGDEPAPAGNFANLGAFGTTAQASLSPMDFVVVTRPEGGETYPAGRPLTIEWRTDGDYAGTLGIELWQGGALARVIASTEANDGVFTWTVPNDVAEGDYRIRLVRDADGVEGFSGKFTLAAAITEYYVAPPADGGDNANDGLSAATPMSDVKALLDRYDLGAGDTVNVAAGTYDLSQNLSVLADDAGVTIRGAGAATVLNRGDLATGSWGVEVRADDVTVRDLQITGADFGLVLPGDVATSGFLAENLVITDNDFGVSVGDTHDAATLRDLEVSDSRTLLYLDGTNHLVDGGDYHTGQYLIEVDGGGHTLQGLSVRDAQFRLMEVNGTGHLVRTSTFTNAPTGVDARSAGTTLAGNLFGGLTNVGVQLSSGSVLDGTTADGPNVVQNVTNGSGNARAVVVGNAAAVGNTVRDSDLGVSLEGSGTVRGNLVTGNAAGGIRDTGRRGGAILGNTVRDNVGLGISTAWIEPLIVGNVVTGNTGGGIGVGTATSSTVFGADVRNNTVVGNTGFGIKVTNADLDDEGNVLRNNVIVQGAGSAILADSTATPTLTSDFNVVQAADVYATWDGDDHVTRADLVNATQQARHSREGDPRFVDAPAGDYRLLPGSPAIDAGDPADEFGREPVPGSRINAGAFGHTADAAAGLTLGVDVVDPAGLERIPAGSAVDARWVTVGVYDREDAYESAALAQGAAAYLGLDDAADLVGGPAATTLGDVTLGVDPRFATGTGAARFDGGRVELVNPAADQRREVGFSFWMNADGLGDERWSTLVRKGRAADTYIYDGAYTLAYEQDGSLQFVTRGSSRSTVATPAGTVTPGRWQHVAAGMDRDAGIARIWVDGVLVAEGTVQTGDAYDTAGLPLTFGGQSVSASYTYAGRMDEFQLLTSMPTDADVAALARLSVGTVDVEAVDAAGNATPVALGVADDGAETLTLPASLAGGTYTLRVTHTDAANGVASGESRPFTVVGDVSEYFVATTGDDANDGQASDRPMRTLAALLAAYDLDAGDVVNLASGTYTLGADVTIDPQDDGVTIRGAADGSTVLDRADAANGTAALRLAGTTGVTLENLRIIGAHDGVFVSGTTAGLTLRNLTVVGNDANGVSVFGDVSDLLIDGGTFSGHTDRFRSGVRFDADVAGLVVRGATFVGNQIGIDADRIEGENHLFENNTFTDNAVTGLDYRPGGGVDTSTRVIRGNTVGGSGVGIYAWYANVDDNDLTGNGVGVDAQRAGVTNNRISGARAANSGGFGIDAFDGLVAGNTIDDADTGITATGEAVVRGNTVSNSSTGIRGDDVLLDANTVTRSGVGVLVVNEGTAAHNRLTGNTVGLRTDGTYSRGITLANNLIVGSQAHALDLVGETATFFSDGVARYAALEVVNNTLVHGDDQPQTTPRVSDGTRNPRLDRFQGIKPSTSTPLPTTNPATTPAAAPASGAAIAVADGFDGLAFRNNIVASAGQPAFEVAAESAWTFAGEYNLYHVTDADLATWDGRAVADAATLFHELGLGVNAVFADPQLGTDFVPSAGSPAIDAGRLGDDASAETAGGNGRVDLGHTGNTALAGGVAGDALHAVVAGGRFVRADADHPLTVAWSTRGLSGTAAVELIDAAGNATPLGSADLADGSVTLAVPAAATPGTHRVRVTAGGLSATTGTFEVVRPGTTLYVTTDGDLAHDGKSPDRPLPSVSAALNSYDLGSADVVLVDAGTYTPLRNVLVTANDAGVTLRGTETGRSEIARGHADVRTAWGVELLDADDVTLQDLHVTGGYFGIAALDEVGLSTGVSVLGGSVAGAGRIGVNVAAGHDGLSLDGLLIDGGSATPTGLRYMASGLTLTGGEVRDHTGVGVQLNDSSQFTPLQGGHLVKGNLFTGNAGHGLLGEKLDAFDVADNTFVGNGVGVDVDAFRDPGDEPAAARIAGNVFTDQVDGAVAALNVGLIEGNVATGGGWGYDVVASSGSSRPTLVRGNTAALTSGDGFTMMTFGSGTDRGVRLAATGNLAYANDGRGFAGDLGLNAVLDGNVAYSNNAGFDLDELVGTFTNNLAYANATLAARVGGVVGRYVPTTVANNTLWQPVGEALVLGTSFQEAGHPAIGVFNNVLVADSGVALSIDTAPEFGSTPGVFDVSHNLYDLGPAGVAGSFDGTAGATYAAFAALAGATDGLEADAGLLDADGADDVLGYDFVQNADGGADDNLTPAAGSAAIDRGRTAGAPATDALGFGRQDDPGTPDYEGPVDLGAFEFLGNTADSAAPLVTGFAADEAGVVLGFSEPLNAIDAEAAGNYDLRRAGPDGLYDTGDDEVLDVSIAYDAAAGTVTLTPADGSALADGSYRLTVSGSGALRDLAGNALDGDADGTAGGAYTQTFTLAPAAEVVSVALAEVPDADPAQRSVVSGAVVVFDAPFTPTADTFELRRVRDAGNAAVDQVAAGLLWTDLDGDGLRWRVEFGQVTVGPDAAEDGSLPDGVYVLTATTGSGSPQTLRFHRLFGDVDGNAVVSQVDLLAFQRTYNAAAGDARFDAAFDANGDGVISQIDLLAFQSRYNRSLTI